MEQIYFAVSPQFQGLVKIGRTDRDISERMGELAGYGLEGFAGVSSWSPSKKHVLVVDDNTVSEALLHRHFADLRVSDDRELFVAGDIDSMVSEAQSLTGATLLSEIADQALSETLVEQAAEWGVAIAGAFVGGVPGIVLANKGLEKIKKTENYRRAKSRGQDAARQGLALLSAKLDEHAELGHQIKSRANQVFSKLREAAPFLRRADDRKDGAGGSDAVVADAEKDAPKIGRKALLSTFFQLADARAFAKDNPRLTIQRVPEPANNLWGVYATLTRVKES